MSTSQILQFRLPDLGEGVATSEIVRWLVAVGDAISVDDPMVEVMTDKATVEIPAPASGVVTRLCVEEGVEVPVGTVIIEIETTEQIGGVGSARASVRPPAPADSATPVRTASQANAQSSPGSRPQATPLVRRMAAELGVDLTTLSGSGPGGRITERDVRAATGGDGPAAQSVETDHPEDDSASSHAPVARTIPLRGVRGMIAQHLTSAAAVPTVTVVEDCDLTALDAARDVSGVGYLPYLVQAVVAGLVEVPELNATVDADAGVVQVHDRIDIGVAVQTERGLVVPVLRDCASSNLEELDRRIVQIAERARNDELAPEDLRGGTFTITSAGRYGGLFTTPLLNVPQAGILGLHRAGERAVVRDGEVVVRHMANLSVTFDHRALDGIDASRFLLTTITALQELG